MNLCDPPYGVLDEALLFEVAGWKFKVCGTLYGVKLLLADALPPWPP
jgi:hypothetical protein